MNSPLNELPFSTHFDCVVMLTWSNWNREMRSNRYHYATRFAKHLPVIFVQADLEEVSYQYENTEVENITIFHVWQTYDQKQNELLNLALLEKKYIKPLLWIYNPLFIDFIIQRYSTLKIYHATEDYFTNADNFFSVNDTILINLKKVMNHVNLLISVSKGVEISYLNATGYSGEHFVLPNGCDFTFWQEYKQEQSQDSKQKMSDSIQG